MKKTLFSILALFLSLGLFPAQAQFLQDINGRPILETKYVDVQGTPYLNEEWTEGVVKLANGQSYKGIQLKYDQVADELLFNHKGQALTFVEPVQEFKVNESVFRNGFKTNESKSEKMFFEVLYDGGVKLIRRRAKQIVENKEYNSATTIKKFVSVESLYIVRGTEVVKVKKDKKSVLSALSDKTAQLESYIKSNNLNLKNEESIVKLLEYYSTI